MCLIDISDTHQFRVKYYYSLQHAIKSFGNTFDSLARLIDFIIVNALTRNNLFRGRNKLASLPSALMTFKNI